MPILEVQRHFRSVNKNYPQYNAAFCQYALDSENYKNREAKLCSRKTPPETWAILSIKSTNAQQNGASSATVKNPAALKMEFYGTLQMPYLQL